MKKQIPILLLVAVLISCSVQNPKPSESQKTDILNQSVKPSIENLTPSEAPTIKPVKKFELTAQEIKQINDSRLVQANNSFGTKLFLNLAKENLNKNLFISPTSAAIALQMAYNAADGKNKSEMEQILELTSIPRDLEVNSIAIDELNSLNKLLSQKLSNPASDIQLNIANALWADKNRIELYDTFKKTLVDFYNADAINLDFKKSQETADAINKWAAEKTNNKITKLFEKEYFEDPYSVPVSILANAIYFKADWQKKFKKEDTQLKKEFKDSDGVLKDANFMYDFREFKYYNHSTRYENQKIVEEENKFEVAGLNYGKDGKLSLYIFLPAEKSSLEKFYTGLTSENIDYWINSMHSGEGQISFPKFKMKDSYDFIPLLKKQGMNLAFDPTQNEFPKLGKILPPLDSNIYINKVSQDVFIDVNEEGSEAAAVTTIGMAVPGSASPTQVLRFVANRPFFYIIRDNETRSNLFMGSVTNPEYN